MTTSHLSEQEQVRRQSLEEIRKLGIDPYPAAMYPVNVSAAEILEGFSD
jgi:lysyl-tRNA synthetase class 2